MVTLYLGFHAAQDGPAPGGPQGRRDRRRRRRAGLLPAVLLVAAVVRARRSAVIVSASRSAPGGCSSSASVLGALALVRLGLRVLPGRARPLDPHGNSWPARHRPSGMRGFVGSRAPADTLEEPEPDGSGAFVGVQGVEHVLSRPSCPRPGGAVRPAARRLDAERLRQRRRHPQRRLGRRRRGRRRRLRATAPTPSPRTPEDPDAGSVIDQRQARRPTSRSTTRLPVDAHERHAERGHRERLRRRRRADRRDRRRRRQAGRPTTCSSPARRTP